MGRRRCCGVGGTPAASGLILSMKLSEQITRKTEVHAALPVIQRRGGERTLHEIAGSDGEIENRCIRVKRDAVKIFQPRDVHPAHHVPRHQRIII